MWSTALLRGAAEQQGVRGLVVEQGRGWRLGLTHNAVHSPTRSPAARRVLRTCSKPHTHKLQSCPSFAHKRNAPVGRSPRGPASLPTRGPQQDPSATGMAPRSSALLCMLLLAAGLGSMLLVAADGQRKERDEQRADAQVLAGAAAAALSSCVCPWQRAIPRMQPVAEALQSHMSEGWAVQLRRPSWP